MFTSSKISVNHVNAQNHINSGYWCKVFHYPLCVPTHFHIDPLFSIIQVDCERCRGLNIYRLPSQSTKTRSLFKPGLLSFSLSFWLSAYILVYNNDRGPIVLLATDPKPIRTRDKDFQPAELGLFNLFGPFSTLAPGISPLLPPLHQRQARI